MAKVLQALAFAVAANPRAIKSISRAYERDIAAALRRRIAVIAFQFGNDQIILLNRVKAAHQLLEGKNAQGDFDGVIARWIRRHAVAAAKNIAESFRKTLANIIADAFNDGANERETGRRIRNRAPEISRKAAERIARTETHSAAERGSYDAAKASGLEMVKEWASAEDQRTRASHAEADGQIKEMDVPFTVGTESLLFPGDPSAHIKEIVNCRCVALYHPIIDGEIIR
ncbi:MAG: phage minor head protein [Ahrensia sp.]|nr:phage minor head protein [Ahrensia sp.]